MNAALLRKTLRDSAALLALVTLAILAFEVVLVRAYRELPFDSIGVWLHRPFVRRLLEMYLGADPTAALTPTGIVTVGFAHPLLFALTWTLLLAVCTRVTVGEIERGTADLLLTLPLSRAAIYATTSAAWVLIGIPVSLAPLGGVCLGQWLSPLWEPIDLARLVVPTINLFVLYLSVGCVTMFVSSAVSRRGNALAIVLAGLLASFLLNFVAVLWSAAERIAFLGLLNYYKPLLYIRDGHVPVRDFVALGAVAAAAWASGLFCYSRRDIPVV